jgi:hypothetical protein
MVLSKRLEEISGAVRQRHQGCIATLLLWLITAAAAGLKNIESYKDKKALLTLMRIVFGLHRCMAVVGVDQVCLGWVSRPR